MFALGRAIVGAAACGDGGDADGRHRGVLGADAGIRAGHPRDAAVGADAAALLDGRRERRRWIYWVALGLEAGLLLLTTYAGLILVGLLLLYTVSTRLGRAQIETVGPWIAGIAMTAVLFPYLIWLDLSAGISFLDLATIAGNLRVWGWLVVALLREPCRHGRS